MRIISGIARGTRLVTLEGIETRPTLDRVKEPLFSIIQMHIRGARVLDLFAGSGALGLEALSRGAESAVFCDVSNKAINVINQNIQKTKFTDKTRVFQESYEDVLKELAMENNNSVDGECTNVFDLIFLDPPYAGGMLENAIQSILDYNLLAEDGIIVVETDMESELKKLQSIGLYVKDIRKYGRVILLFLEHKK